MTEPHVQIAVDPTARMLAWVEAAQFSRCASPGCHNLLRPSAFPQMCSNTCHIIRTMADYTTAVAHHWEAIARELAPVMTAFGRAMRGAAEQINRCFGLLLPPKRTGPPPLSIDGHAYRNRTRRRTRKNRR